MASEVLGLGSSPLTRGKPRSACPRGGMSGLIPAHAGKTGVRCFRSFRSSAHPRSRGENSPCADPCTIHLGSSPLTRGKPPLPGDVLNSMGLIPAHAGKTLNGQAITTWTKAHPRSRGENETLTLRVGEREGSSPLTRGKHVHCPGPVGSCGLIPAHAGKTLLNFAPPATVRAHPRSRGENPALCGGPGAMGGSSPLTRGKRPRALSTRHASAAHPRSRGENGEKWDTATPRGGSSPLTRGKRDHDRDFRRAHGLIPAHAGKTAARRPRRERPRAHPRSRGENLRVPSMTGAWTGSSPLTRGKRSGSCHRPTP